MAYLALEGTPLLIVGIPGGIILFSAAAGLANGAEKGMEDAGYKWILKNVLKGEVTQENENPDEDDRKQDDVD